MEKFHDCTFGRKKDWLQNLDIFYQKEPQQSVKKATVHTLAWNGTFLHLQRYYC